MLLLPALFATSAHKMWFHHETGSLNPPPNRDAAQHLTVYFYKACSHRQKTFLSPASTDSIVTTWMKTWRFVWVGGGVEGGRGWCVGWRILSDCLCVMCPACGLPITDDS